MCNMYIYCDIHLYSDNLVKDNHFELSIAIKDYVRINKSNHQNNCNRKNSINLYLNPV